MLYLLVLLGLASGTMFVAGTADDEIIGTDNADNIDANAGDDIVYGEGGADEILGNDGNDYIFGGADNDTLSGDAGDDFIVGDAGDDSILSGTGTDMGTGGAGNDTIASTGDANIFSGGLGADSLTDGAGDSVLHGDDWGSTVGGDDTLRGGGGDDTLFGGAGDDELRAGTGNDLVDGGLGNDLIIGDAGDDEVLGGDGQDTLIGGTGYDELRGGDGSDLIFNSESGRAFGGAGDDVLVGVGPGELLAAFEDGIIDDEFPQDQQSQGGMLLDGGAGTNHIFASSAGNTTVLGGDDFDRIYIAGGSGNLVDAGTGSDNDDDIADFGESTIYSGGGLDYYSLSADETNQISTLPDIDIVEDALVILLNQAELDTNPSIRENVSYGVDATGQYTTLNYTHSGGFVETVAHIPIDLASVEDIQNNLGISFANERFEDPDGALLNALSRFVSSGSDAT